MTIAVCPGSYDPVTAGHLDVIQRCAHLFDEVHVLVAVNAAKKPLFSEAERVQIISDAVRKFPKVEECNYCKQHTNRFSCKHGGTIVVTSTTGLISDYCTKVGATAIVKGLRQNGDYEAELGMALVNRKLSGIETLFLPADPVLEHVSSSVVKDVARHGGNVAGMVPDNVIPLLRKLFGGCQSDCSSPCDGNGSSSEYNSAQSSAHNTVYNIVQNTAQGDVTQDVAAQDVAQDTVQEPK